MMGKHGGVYNLSGREGSIEMWMRHDPPIDNVTVVWIDNEFSLFIDGRLVARREPPIDDVGASVERLRRWSLEQKRPKAPPFETTTGRQWSPSAAVSDKDKDWFLRLLDRWDQWLESFSVPSDSRDPG